jgi:hypothetical protein
MSPSGLFQPEPLPQRQCHFNVQKFEFYIDNLARSQVAFGSGRAVIRHISVHDSFVDKKRFAQSTPMHRHSFENVRLIYTTTPLFSQTMDRGNLKHAPGSAMAQF